MIRYHIKSNLEAAFFLCMSASVYPKFLNVIMSYLKVKAIF